MSEQRLQAGERRQTETGTILALSPLPAATGAEALDPVQWIRQKNNEWTFRGGGLVFAAELALMFMSLCILLFLAMAYTTAAFYSHNGYLIWEPTVAAVIGSVFFTAPFGVGIHFRANVIELVTFLHKYHRITPHTLARKTPYEAPAKTHA
jgi:hypothetical protein